MISSFSTVVGPYINTMKRTFYLSFDFHQSFVELQDYKESLLTDKYSLFLCLNVSMLLKSLEDIKIEIKSSLLLLCTTTTLWYQFTLDISS